MVNLIHKLGHIVKQDLITIKNNVVIYNIKKQKNFKKITVNENRKPQIIVSLTSYRKRFPTLDICLKSLLNQTLLPDHIILYLSKKDEKYIPDSVKKLEQYGLEIKFVDLDLKPHKKYYYVMKEYPNDIIITVDDDVVYNRHLIDTLYKTYKKFPNCVAVARARKITFKNEKMDSYLNWNLCNDVANTPSFLFLGTGVGGVLYPPHLLNLNLLLNLKYINKYITVDDLWLKTVEVLSNVPLVICDKKIDQKRIEIPSAQDIGLTKQNVDGLGNDINLKSLDENFDLSLKIREAEKITVFR
ncbi:glycosyltransferase family 2 protein [Lactobacillus amylovorus]|nr:glycosyltransferase family 2 protein [Lactobacillus amylovorus]